MTIPAEFLAGNDTFKYEVLAREKSWNQTAMLSGIDDPLVLYAALVLLTDDGQRQI